MGFICQKCDFLLGDSYDSLNCCESFLMSVKPPPPGSILGPVLFPSYVLPLGAVIAKHNSSVHCYTNDLQIYLPVKPKGSDALNSLFNCISDIKLRPSLNFLNSNDDKTERVVFGTSYVSNSLVSSFGAPASYVKLPGINLGRTFVTIP